jgi:uncharacterized protein
MKLLIDTNIFLEIFLSQAQAQLAKDFLANPENYELYLSDFSLHSIGVILLRKNLPQLFQQFLTDVISSGNVGVIYLLASDLSEVAKTAQTLGLDFDDAYQYLAAEMYDLTIISFDSDFDKTPRGRATLPLN